MQHPGAPPYGYPPQAPFPYPYPGAPQAAGGVPIAPGSAALAPQHQQQQPQTAPQQKEKPKHKTPIPGTDGPWLRITTNLGNVFYTHPPTKRSEWAVPAEIKAAVRELESAERREAEEAARAEREAAERAERLRREAQEEEARKARGEREREKRDKAQNKEDEEERRKAEAERQDREYREAVKREMLAQAQANAQKRKNAAGDAASDNEDDSQATASKRLRSDHEDEAREGEEMDEDEEEGEEEDEEEWQRRIAAEMAAELGPPPPTSKSKEKAAKQAELQASAVQHASAPAMPVGADLSKAEATAIFHRMLTSLNGTPAEVDPMMPWDRELPKFVAHPQYMVLKNLRDREDAFNEWCKLRIKQKRAERAAAAAGRPSALTPSAAAETSEAPADAEAGRQTTVPQRRLPSRSCSRQK